MRGSRVNRTSSSGPAAGKESPISEMRDVESVTAKRTGRQFLVDGLGGPAAVGLGGGSGRGGRRVAASAARRFVRRRDVVLHARLSAVPEQRVRRAMARRRVGRLEQHVLHLERHASRPKNERLIHYALFESRDGRALRDARRRLAHLAELDRNEQIDGRSEAAERIELP